VIDFRERPSPNHAGRDRPGRIDMLVLHYTGMQSAAAAIERLCDLDARVSAHYVVGEDGTVWRLVAEERRAFHAGISCWRGEHDLNHVSIGVEIVNPGHEWGYRRFPEMQMAAVERLCHEVTARNPIPPDRVVGHSDIAPDRKADPGELFDWPRLARAGIGLWPAAAEGIAAWRSRPLVPVERAGALHDLATIGYCVGAGSETVALAAFQRRFRPERWDGRLDGETSLRLAEVRAAYDAARAPLKRKG
jgi:N-acetylmuramoyl-L-alanine amidase